MGVLQVLYGLVVLVCWVFWFFSSFFFLFFLLKDTTSILLLSGSTNEKLYTEELNLFHTTPVLKTQILACVFATVCF